MFGGLGRAHCAYLVVAVRRFKFHLFRKHLVLRVLFGLEVLDESEVDRVVRVHLPANCLPWRFGWSTRLPVGGASEPSARGLQ